MDTLPTIRPADEHDLYPVHAEDTVPEGEVHYWQGHYLAGALEIRFPELWVKANHCLYWRRGDEHRYVAPDVAVVSGSAPPQRPNVYLAWIDPPLRLVIEIASDSTRRNDLGRKVAIYAENLEVPEYLTADPESLDLQLRRREGGRYRLVSPREDGRVWSEEVRVWFGWDETGFLRIWDADGRMLLTQREEHERAEAQARRAEAEAARRAELERSLTLMAAELERLRGRAGDLE